MTYDELLPYFERTDRDFGVSGLGGNPKYPPGADPPLPPLPIGKSGLLLARAHARLGWHWWPEPNAIASVDYDGRHACVQRGTCSSGCNEGAKASTDLTHWPVAIAHGARLVTGARVPAHRGRRPRTRHRRGVDRRRRAASTSQAASVVLCAANGVGTARLLLLSATSAAARRPGQLVGPGRAAPHAPPVRTCRGLLPREHRELAGPVRVADPVARVLRHRRPTRDFVGGSKWSLAPTGGPLARRAAARPEPGARRRTPRVRARAVRARRAVDHALRGPAPRAQPRRALDDLGRLVGDPRARAHVRARRQLRAHHGVERRARGRVARSRPARAFTEPLSTTNSSHLLGTARMGNDPRTSVVDEWCMTHDVPNLGVIDGSVFVTAGAVNPTSTICALALRAVEHLIERRGDVRVPEPAGSFADRRARRRRRRRPDAVAEPVSEPSVTDTGPVTDARRTRPVGTCSPT